MRQDLGGRDPGRRRAPFIVENDLAHGLAFERSMPACWNPEGDARGERRAVGNPQHQPQLVFHAQVPHRQRTAVSERSSGEEQVLTSWVDRRSFERTGVPISLQADQDHNRDRFKVIDEVSHGVHEAAGPIWTLTLCSGAFVIPTVPERLAEQ